MNIRKTLHVAKRRVQSFIFFFTYRAQVITSCFLFYLIKVGWVGKKINKINIGSGMISLPEYCNLDIYTQADLIIDLERKLLPFKDNSIDVAVCISTINYFTRKRGEEIIKDTFRVLKPGGIARFGVQDLKLIVTKYINNDREFFFQKLPDGRERFTGATIADKINSWFYGYACGKNRGGKYFYDYETLALLFKEAGFSKIENKKYQESAIPNITAIDNRPEQMFFLEAVK
jgi:predicted SAM-dependent methyltransferase